MLYLCLPVSVFNSFFFFSAVIVFFLLSCLFYFFSLLSLLFLSLISLELIFDYPLYSLEFLSLGLRSCPFASLYMTFFLFICLFAWLSSCLFTWLVVYLSIVCVHLTLCLYLILHVYLSACWFVSMSPCLKNWLSAVQSFKIFPKI